MPEWIESQMRALMGAGLNARDAYNTLRWVMAKLPWTTLGNLELTVSTWKPTADQLLTPLDEQAVEDARLAWHAPDWAQRLLDAVEE